MSLSRIYYGLTETARKADIRSKSRTKSLEDV